MDSIHFMGEGFKITENLTEMISEKFDNSLSQKSIIYVESEVEHYQGKGFCYQIRIVPAFAKKPNAIRDEASETLLNAEGKGTALLDISPERVVAEAGPFRVVINKYCAVKNQIILTSILPRSQSEALDAYELTSVSQILNALPPNHLAFYNCGTDSGASQPHKHVQIVPLEPDVYRDLFPNQANLKSVSSKVMSRPTLVQHPDVPYTHFIVQRTEECTGEYLQSLFDTLLSVTISALVDQLGTPQPTPSYNFFIAPDWLMMIPRTNVGYNGVGVGALGMLGILWLKNDEQLQRWRATGFDDILIHAGLRKVKEGM